MPSNVKVVFFVLQSCFFSPSPPSQQSAFLTAAVLQYCYMYALVAARGARRGLALQCVRALSAGGGSPSLPGTVYEESESARTNLYFSKARRSACWAGLQYGGAAGVNFVSFRASRGQRRVACRRERRADAPACEWQLGSVAVWRRGLDGGVQQGSTPREPCPEPPLCAQEDEKNMRKRKLGAGPTFVRLRSCALSSLVPFSPGQGQGRQREVRQRRRGGGARQRGGGGPDAGTPISAF